MYASVRAFLHQVIDYAGLFPPAKLPLETALKEYLHHKKSSPHAWMLGRFVCPTVQLAELLPLTRAHNHEDAGQFQVTALAKQGSTMEDFFVQLETAILAIQEFRRAWGADNVVDMIEIPAPAAKEEIDRVASSLHYTVVHLRTANLRGFLEIPMTATWQHDVKRTAQAIQEFEDAHDDRVLGLKLRCGGLTAEAFPSDEQVAFFIDCCRAANLPWKATAGLHHPRRHWDASLNLWRHGFLNVFGAGLLAQAHPLTVADLIAILSDREGQHFRFADDRFSWKDWSCTAAQVAEFRTSGPTSFGSCSFTEPCDDLTALGLLT